MAEDSGSWLWALATIGGPIILLLALAYAVLRTRSWRRARVRPGDGGATEQPASKDRR